jgi:hypothetical protein
MKKTVLSIIVLCYTFILHAQSFPGDYDNQPIEKRNAVTFGFLQGGGGLVGVDVEFLVTNKLGLQIGAGLVSFGGGINYHFKPSVRSSYLSLQYWHQGLHESFYQDIIGPTYVFRARKLFTFQIGMGSPIRKGPAYPDDKELMPVILLYSIGIYLPM